MRNRLAYHSVAGRSAVVLKAVRDAYGVQLQLRYLGDQRLPVDWLPRDAVRVAEEGDYALSYTPPEFRQGDRVRLVNSLAAVPPVYEIQRVLGTTWDEHGRLLTGWRARWRLQLRQPQPLASGAADASGLVVEAALLVAADGSNARRRMESAAGKWALGATKKQLRRTRGGERQRDMAAAVQLIWQGQPEEERTPSHTKPLLEQRRWKVSDEELRAACRMAAQRMSKDAAMLHAVALNGGSVQARLRSEPQGRPIVVDGRAFVETGEQTLLAEPSAKLAKVMAVVEGCEASLCVMSELHLPAGRSEAWMRAAMTTGKHLAWRLLLSAASPSEEATGVGIWYDGEVLEAMGEMAVDQVGRIVRQRFRVISDASEFVLVAAYAPPRRLVESALEARRRRLFWRTQRARRCVQRERAASSPAT